MKKMVENLFTYTFAYLFIKFQFERSMQDRILSILVIREMQNNISRRKCSKEANCFK